MLKVYFGKILVWDVLLKLRVNTGVTSAGRNWMLPWVQTFWGLPFWWKLKRVGAHTVDARNPAITSWGWKFIPLFRVFFYIQTVVGLGISEPSTVCWYAKFYLRVDAQVSWAKNWIPIFFVSEKISQASFFVVDLRFTSQRRGTHDFDRSKSWVPQATNDINRAFHAKW